MTFVSKKPAANRTEPVYRTHSDGTSARQKRVDYQQPDSFFHRGFDDAYDTVSPQDDFANAPLADLSSLQVPEGACNQIFHLPPVNPPLVEPMPAPEAAFFDQLADPACTEAELLAPFRQLMSTEPYASAFEVAGMSDGAWRVALRMLLMMLRTQQTGILLGRFPKAGMPVDQPTLDQLLVNNFGGLRFAELNDRGEAGVPLVARYGNVPQTSAVLDLASKHVWTFLCNVCFVIGCMWRGLPIRLVSPLTRANTLSAKHVLSPLGREMVALMTFYQLLSGVDAQGRVWSSACVPREGAAVSLYAYACALQRTTQQGFEQSLAQWAGAPASAWHTVVLPPCPKPPDSPESLADPDPAELVLPDDSRARSQTTVHPPAATGGDAHPDRSHSPGSKPRSRSLGTLQTT